MRTSNLPQDIEKGMIRNNLRIIAERRNFSIQDICDRSGLPRITVGRLFRNETTQIRFDTLVGICSALGIRLDELIEYVPPYAVTDADVQQVNHRKEHNRKVRLQRYGEEYE